MKRIQLVDLGRRTVRMARRESLTKNCKAHFVALSHQTRRRCAATKDLIVGMRRNDQYLHLPVPFPCTRVIVTSATTRPSYSAERLNSKRNPECCKNARG